MADFNLPRLLKLARARHQHNQATAARELDVDPDTFRRWENAKRTPGADMYRRLSEYLALPLEEVLDGIEASRPKRGTRRKHAAA